MAKSKFGILGPISGKLGPVVGGVWKGIPYLRLAPDKTSEKKIRTERQLANEEKMTFLNNALVPFHAFINIGFQHLAIGKTALSAAYSVNYHQALIGQYPNFAIDYTKFMISTGILPGLDHPAALQSSAESLELTWQNSSSSKTRFDDQIMLVVYCPELHMTQGMAGGAIRRDLKFNMILADELVGKVLEVFVSVTSFDRRKISDSVHLVTIQP